MLNCTLACASEEGCHTSNGSGEGERSGCLQLEGVDSGPLGRPLRSRPIIELWAVGLAPMTPLLYISMPWAFFVQIVPRVRYPVWEAAYLADLMYIAARECCGVRSRSRGCRKSAPSAPELKSFMRL